MDANEIESSAFMVFSHLNIIPIPTEALFGIA